MSQITSGQQLFNGKGELSSVDKERKYKDYGEQQQLRIPRTLGRQSLSEVTIFDSRRSRRRGAVAVNGHQSVVPQTLVDSLHFLNNNSRQTNIPFERGAKENPSSRNRISYRKSRRQRSEIPPLTDHQQHYQHHYHHLSRLQPRIRKSVLSNYGKSSTGQVSSEAMERDELMEGHRFSRAARDNDQQNYYQQQSGGSLPERLPHHSLQLERAKLLTDERYPNAKFPAASFGRSHASNIRDISSGFFPLSGYGSAFTGISSPAFYLPSQTASRTSGFYIPVQGAVTGPGATSGFLPPTYYPLNQFAPGADAMSRFYSPSMIASGTAPSAIYPPPQIAAPGFGFYPRAQVASGNGLPPHAFYPPSSTIAGIGAQSGLLARSTPAPLLSRFYPLSQSASGISPFFSTHHPYDEKTDQPLAQSQGIILPITEPPPVSSEIFGSVSSASTSAATTAASPTLIDGIKSSSQQKFIEQQWMQPQHGTISQDRISSRSDLYTSVPSSESFEFTPQFSMPIVRLFGGLFVHNHDESHYVTTDSMPLIT